MKRADVCRLALFAVALGVTILSYRHLLDLSFGRAFGRAWYLSYRLLVPLFSLFCLIHDRRAIRAAVGEPSAAGLLLLVPCLAVGWLGEQGMQIRFEILGFLGTLLALVWTFFGVRTARAVLFPVCYLVFFLYFAAWFTTGFALPRMMKALASALVQLTMEAVGFSVLRQGSLIVVPELRMSIDAMAGNFGAAAANSALVLVAAYSFFAQPTNMRRLLLVAAGIPLVVIGNVFCSCAGIVGNNVIVLAVCTPLTVGVSRLITEGAKRCARS